MNKKKIATAVVTSKYECNHCMFYTNKYTDYSRHISTQKHKTLSACSECNHVAECNTTVTVRITQSYKCKFCDKPYTARNSVWYHEKRCQENTGHPSPCSVTSDNSAPASGVTDAPGSSSELSLALQNKTKDEVIDRLLKDNAEMMKLLKEIVPRIGPTTMIMNSTTHNKFNINVFLNEHCKDALNISDFVNSIKITMQDLKLTEERGIVESISNVLVQGLNDMDICKRPIHCTDLKRDILYVKENEQWERDETQEHLRKSVNNIAYKQILSVENWKNSLPNLNCDDSLQLQYNSLLQKTLADPGEKDVKKIVKSVCKQVYISDLPSILEQSQNQVHL
ncbi:MAG: hypothetical protein EBQ95_05785 [Gammaproteobacteria bacterium]|nr:hypothetical protein [Gammaproteobacteria bacterium]